MPVRHDLIKIDHYIELVQRKRWLIIIPFCLAMIVGIYQAITLPKIYQASTLILIEPQSVPEGFVQSIVSTDIDSRISTISQQILSRTNLEKIIKNFRLFSSAGGKDMFMEDKIAAVRNRIKVDVTRTRRFPYFQAIYCSPFEKIERPQQPWHWKAPNSWGISLAILFESVYCLYVRRYE